MTNHLELIKQITLNNDCVAILPEFMIKDELQQKSLLECLGDYKIPEQTVYAIYPDKRFTLPILKFFLEKIKIHLGSK